MAKVAAKTKGKKVLSKDKLSKHKKSSPVSTAKSTVKKKKKKKRSEEEDILRKKKAKVSKIEEPVEDDDDLDDEDEEAVAIDDETTEVEDVDDTEESDADDEEAETASNTRAQLGKIDPGPDVSEVPCGLNCGSCRKFVRLDDPCRDDPEWLTTMVSKKKRLVCPFLFPEDIDIPDQKSLSEFVMRADTKACDQFNLNDERASPELLQVLNTVRAHLQRDEIDVVSICVDRIRSSKEDEDKYGYKLGEQMTLRVRGSDGEHMVKCEVLEFQRKKGEEVIVRPLSKVKGVPSRLAIPARRAVVLS